MKTTQKISGARACASLVAVGGALALGASAFADVSDPIIRVTASNSQGSGTFSVPLSQATMNPDGSFVFALPAPQAIMSGANTIATVTQISTFIRPRMGVMPNLVGLGFAVQAGNSATTFTIDTATLSFASLSGASGRASAGIGVTDTNGDGVTLTPAEDNNSVYEAFFNSTIFASLITAPVQTSVPNGSASASQALPGNGQYLGIADPVTGMHAQWKFTLSAQDMAGDTAGGTGVWEVIPGPGSAGLLVLGLLGLGRRRRV